MSSTIQGSKFVLVTLLAVLLEGIDAEVCTIGADCPAGKQCMQPPISQCYRTGRGFVPNREGVGQTACGVGTYAPLPTNNVECVNCAPGTYQNVATSSMCKSCPPQHTSPEAATDVSECTASPTSTTSTMSTTSTTSTMSTTSTTSTTVAETVTVTATTSATTTMSVTETFTTTMSITETWTETVTGTATDTVTFAFNSIGTVPLTPTAPVSNGGSVVSTAPAFWLRINNMDFAALSVDAKNQVCDSLRLNTAQRLQVLLTQVFCRLSSGSVYAKVWVHQQNNMQVLQEVLNDAKEDIAAKALEHIKESPALIAASTGPLSTEQCGGGDKAVCHGAIAQEEGALGGVVFPQALPATQVVIPLAQVLVVPDAVPAGSMPSSVEAATLMGSALGKQEVVALPSHFTGRFTGIVVASVFLGLSVMVSCFIWARRDGNEVASEQQDDQLQE